MIALLALLLGALLGFILQPDIPAPITAYVPIAVVAGLHAIFGGVRARLDGTFSDRVFIVSFLSNVVLATFLVFIGDLLGAGSELSTAVLVVFGVRIFDNLAAVRGHLLPA